MRTLFASVCLAFLAAAAPAATGPVRVLYLDAAGVELGDDLQHRTPGERRAARGCEGVLRDVSHQAVRRCMERGIMRQV